jgi:PAS domain S-box-containing protein
MVEALKNSLRRPLYCYGISTAAILLAFLLRRGLGAMLGGGLPPYITFFPVVMLAGLLGGFWPGVAATLMSAFLTAGWILPHDGRFSLEAIDQVSLGIFICVGYGMSVFADVHQKTHQRAERYEKELVERESEVALQQSRERLRVTLSSIADAVITCDARGQITFINPKAAELTGWRAEEATGNPIQAVVRVVNEENGRYMEDSAWQVLREQRPVRRTEHLALVNKDGSRLPIEDSAAPILDARGELTGVVLVFHSVTEQRRAQQRVRASERRYRTLVEMSPEAVVVHLSGKIVYANASALGLYGAKYLEQLQGLYVFDLVHPDDRETVRERIAAVERGGTVPLRELRIARMDGSEVAAEATAGAIDWQGQTAVQSILRDISKRKAAEAILIRNEKLASVGRMAASIAHEINNPLASVMNTVFLARKTPDVPPTALQYLEIAEEELHRISHITRQVLGFYRESSVLKWVAADGIMDSALELLQSRIRAKKATIEKRYRGNLEVKAVGGELRQVFSNLLANSLEAIPPGGTVKLHITGGRCANSGARTVRITVADNGTGIKPAVRPHVFEALFTTRTDTGTGLGLWVSKQIVEKHGGTIRFRTRAAGEATGTVFCVVLDAEGTQRS